MVLKSVKNYGTVRASGPGSFRLPPELILEMDLREGDRFMLIDANPPKMLLGRYLLVPTMDDFHDDVLEIVEIGGDGSIHLLEKTYRRIGLFGSSSIAVIRTEEGLILLDLRMDALGDKITGRV